MSVINSYIDVTIDVVALMFSGNTLVVVILTLRREMQWSIAKKNSLSYIYRVSERESKENVQGKSEIVTLK